MPAMPNPDSLRRVEQVVCKPDSVRCARIRRMTSADGMAVSSSSGVEFILLFIGYSKVLRSRPPPGGPVPNARLDFGGGSTLGIGSE